MLKKMLKYTATVRSPNGMQINSSVEAESFAEAADKVVKDFGNAGFTIVGVKETVTRQQKDK